jgi:hypothetical protein
MVDDPLDAAWRWILLDGNRDFLALVLTVGVFFACIGLEAVGMLAIEIDAPVRSLLTTTLGGLVSFVTIVLAINQLILTQQFGTTADYQNRFEEMRSFRSEVEADADLPVSPADPGAFLQVQLSAIVETAEGLHEAGVCDRVESFATDVITASARAHDRLDAADGGSFELVSVSLDYDGSTLLHRLRTLRATEDLSDAAVEPFDDLESLLEDVHVTSLYFKTVHVQQELADLSKMLLFAGTVALVWGGFVVVSYENILGAGPGRAVPILAICAALAAAFAPFAVLLSHVLRIATVARRTTADFGPFLLQRNIPDEGT